MLDIWRMTLGEFAPWLLRALNSADELQIITAFIELQRLPAKILIPLIHPGQHGDRKFDKEGFQQLIAREQRRGNPLARSSEHALKARVAKHLAKGKLKKAATALLSSGVAKDKQMAERMMRTMHPAPTKRFGDPGNFGPGLQATMAHPWA